MFTVQDLVALGLIDSHANMELDTMASPQDLDSDREPASPSPRLSDIGDLPGLEAPPLPIDSPVFWKPSPAAPSFFLKSLAYTLRPLLSGESDLSRAQQALFFCPNQQSGIPGGSVVPPEIANYQLFVKADAVQLLDRPLYSVGTAVSYFRNVLTYIRYLASEGDGDNMQKARDEIFASERGKDAAYRTARDNYVAERTKESGTHQTFLDFLAKDMKYQTAVQTELTASRSYERGLSPARADVVHELDDLNLANTRDSHKDGNNMPCDSTSWDFINKALLAGEHVPSDPRNIHYLPSYTIIGYDHTVALWSDIHTPQQDVTYAISLDPEDINSFSWAGLGHPGLDQIPPQPLTKEQAALLKQITASLTFTYGPAVVDIERGHWDVVPLASSSLSRSAPSSIREQFFKSSRMVLAWGMKINVKLPAAFSTSATAGIRLSQWGLPLSSVSADGTQLQFSAGGKSYPILVAVLADLVGGE